MKILMLMPNLRLSNGVASFAMNYFRRLDHEQVQMDFAIYRDVPSPYYEEIRQGGGRLFLLPPLRRLPAHLASCRRILREGKYDLLHDHSLLITLPMMVCARAEKVKVRLLHSHSARLSGDAAKQRISRLLSPLLLRAATDYAACSQAAGKALFGDRPFAQIPNVISAERCRYSEALREKTREEHGANGRIIIGTVGRTAAEKNPFFALDVIQALAQREPRIEYWWIGSGPLDGQLAGEVKKRGLEGSVRLLGSREDVPALYAAMDVFFLPSLFEGLPVTAVEAQAMGLPCVISGSVTTELVYTDLVRYVPLEAPAETWAQALEEQIRRIPDRRSYTKELQGSPFCDDNAGERLRSLYEKLLRRR